MGVLDRWRNGAHRRDASPDNAAGPHHEALRLIAEGNELEDAGRLYDALVRYDAAVRVAPSLGRAHMNRGNALLALDNVEAATEAYETALLHDPVHAAARFNLGNAYMRANRRADAFAAYQHALRLKPDFAEAEVALGALQQDLGRHEEAAARYRRALQINPGYTAVHVNLGRVLQELGKPDQAISSYRNAIEQDSQLAVAHIGLGDSLSRLGRHAEASASYRRATELTPDVAVLHFRLGNALSDSGRFSESIQSYRAALRLEPDYADATFNLGNALFRAGQYGEAADCFRQQLALNPDSVDLSFNLGGALQMLGEHQAALESYSRVVQLKPDHAHAHNNMGQALKDLGRLDDAVASCRRALAIEPDLGFARSNLIFVESYMADAHSATAQDDARQFEIWATQRARPFDTWSNAPSPERTLRIGFVSGDLRDHPVGSFVEGAFSALVSGTDRRLEIFAYPTVDAADSVTARIKASCRGWCPAASLSDEALASRVREDAIDILIDLSGHTANNRLTLFAWKAAPVQASWLGFLATTGLQAIDYLIADKWTLPASEEAPFVEKVWRLPRSYLCFRPPDNSPEPGPLPAFGNGHITFGSFNHLTKMNDDVVGVWSRVLKAVPDSRLFLKSRQLRNASMRADVSERFSRHGIDAGRLSLEGLVPRNEYLLPYQRLDIALDPFPYPGITTSVESMWMGVPVLTLAGSSYLSRQGLGLLKNAGLPEWIARDEDEYVARAVAHAEDLPRLGALRQALRRRLLSSPIFDAHGFARDFEAALRGMWRYWCARTHLPPGTDAETVEPNGRDDKTR